MLSSKIDGESVFARIMDDLSHPTLTLEKSKKSSLRYKIYSFTVDKEDPGNLEPSDFIIKSENYGIPQRRHRVILLGIRTDKNHSLDSDLLLETESPISVYDAIGDLPRLRSRISRKIADGGDTFSNWQNNIKSMPINFKW